MGRRFERSNPEDSAVGEEPQILVGAAVLCLVMALIRGTEWLPLAGIGLLIAMTEVFPESKRRLARWIRVTGAWVMLMIILVLDFGIPSL